MNEDTSSQIVSLLQSIDAKLDSLGEIAEKLDSIDALVHDMKMDISGFSHEGKTYPGKLETLESSLSGIESSLGSIDMTLSSIDSKTE